MSSNPLIKLLKLGGWTPISRMVSAPILREHLTGRIAS